jgi:hypothetical protein
MAKLRSRSSRIIAVTSSLFYDQSALMTTIVSPNARGTGQSRHLATRRQTASLSGILKAGLNSR